MRPFIGTSAAPSPPVLECLGTIRLRQCPGRPQPFLYAVIFGKSNDGLCQRGSLCAGNNTGNRIGPTFPARTCHWSDFHGDQRVAGVGGSGGNVNWPMGRLADRLPAPLALNLVAALYLGSLVSLPFLLNHLPWLGSFMVLIWFASTG